MWKNSVERGRPRMTIWRMRIACRVTKATNTTQVMYTYSFSTATMIARTQVNVTLYEYCHVVIKRYHELNVVYKMLNCTAQFIITLSHITQHCRNIDINICSPEFLIKFYKMRFRDIYACIFRVKRHPNYPE